MQLDFSPTTFRVCNRHSTILYQRLNYDHHTSHLKLTSGSMKRSRKFGFFPSALRRLFRNKVLRLNMKRSLRLPKMGGLTLLQLLFRGGFEGSPLYSILNENGLSWPPKNILFNMFYLGPTLLLIVLRHFLIPCLNISIDYRALCINTHLYYRSASKITHLLSFHPAQHNGPSWILINFCNATQLNNLTCQHNFTQLNLWFLKSELTSRNVHPCHLESVEVRRHLEPPAVRHQSMLKLENWILSILSINDYN